jgi:hypothetical protein
MWPLRAKRRVIAVTRVDDGVVAEELLETAWFPGLSDPTREQERSSVGNTSAPERSCPRQTEIYLMECPRLEDPSTEPIGQRASISSVRPTEKWPPVNRPTRVPADHLSDGDPLQTCLRPQPWMTAGW